MNADNPRLSSPYSTSGGGFHFEHKVEALYLSYFLIKRKPAGLEKGIIKLMDFQPKHTTTGIDDVLLTMDDNGMEYRIFMQIKKSLEFKEGSPDFRKVVRDSWRVFVGSDGKPFTHNDLVIIVIGVYQKEIDGDLKTLLRRAEGSDDVKQFLIKIQAPYVSSEEIRDFYNLFYTLLKGIDQNVADVDIMKFLKQIRVVYYDLEDSFSKDKTYCIEALNHVLGITESTSLPLFDRFVMKAGDYSSIAGTMNYAKVLETTKDIVPDIFKRLKKGEYLTYREYQETRQNRFLLTNSTKFVGREKELYRVIYKIQGGLKGKR